MDIAVIGLGLIGGSICKALKQNTGHRVYGIDKDPATVSLALESNSIDGEIAPGSLKSIDLSFICLYPEAVVNFILINTGNFKKGSIVTDVCGIKKYIGENVEKPLFDNGVYYVGGHPMAGRENSGFAYSDAKLLKGASYILTKIPLTNADAYNTVSDIILSMGCNIVGTTPEKHDKIIAYTSQLAHAVSSSYIKSPTAESEHGFTGGSFQDMTRVALLSEDMWADLFLKNRDNLLFEIKNIIKNLSDFENALETSDKDKLRTLLKEGKELKKKHLK